MMFRRVNPATGQYSYEAALIDDSGRIVTAPIVTPTTVAPAPANSFTAIAATAADVQGLSATANLRLMGYSITEAAATAAVAEVSLRHGVAATDPEIVGINLAADGSVRYSFGEAGLATPNGVFVDIVAGTAKATLYWKVAA